MFVLAETKFVIEFDDGALLHGSTQKGQELTQLEDRVIIKEGKVTTTYFNRNILSIQVEEVELDTKGLDLEKLNG